MKQRHSAYNTGKLRLRAKVMHVRTPSVFITSLQVCSEFNWKKFNNSSF